ncbi:MAG: hypothetical protein Q8K21_11935 [Hydrogenophaga sp.]|nr:hypothetical protein [Hydrogenophaga sp.]
MAEMSLSFALPKQLTDSSSGIGRDMGVDFHSIFEAVDIDTATRVERLDEFELFVEIELTQDHARAIALALLRIGPLLPARDRFEVTISVDGEAASASDDGEGSRAKINALFELASIVRAEVAFRVIIRKLVRDNFLSVYDLEAFGHYLINEPIKQVLEAISARLDGHINLECNGLSKPGGSASLQFVPEGYSGPMMAALSSATRERTIALFKETSFSTTLPATLIPLDFQLDFPLGRPIIDEFFRRASAVLSAAYLCNNLELDLNNNLTYRLAGYKVLEEKQVSVVALANAHEVLSKIANWAYDAGGSTDKVGLARNVLSLHASSLPELVGQPHVLNAILSNYQIYLKDNVSAYLDVRNRMAELLLESIAKTHALVESLLDSVRNGMLVVFTFVLTVVVVNGLKDTNVQVIFSGQYLWIVIVIALLCTIWIHHACKDVVARFDSATQITRQLLQDSYRNVLIEDEINQHTNATFLSNGNHLKDQIKKYQRLWYQVSAILVLAFAIGHIVSHQYFSRVDSNVDASSATSTQRPASSEKILGESAGVELLPAATTTPPKSSQTTPLHDVPGTLQKAPSIPSH